MRGKLSQILCFLAGGNALPNLTFRNLTPTPEGLCTLRSAAEGSRRKIDLVIKSKGQIARHLKKDGPGARFVVAYDPGELVVCCVHTKLMNFEDKI